METKKCNDCNLIKPYDEMTKTKASASGMGSYCKPCMKKRSDRFRVDNPIQQMLSIVKSSAKKRGIFCDLKLEDIVVPEYCPYLNIKILSKVGRGLRMDAPSIDRIDSNKGYTKSNIMIISQRANLLKNNLTIKELLTIANNIIKIHTNQESF
jgi:hypothetical protein